MSRVKTLKYAILWLNCDQELQTKY